MKTRWFKVGLDWIARDERGREVGSISRNSHTFGLNYRVYSADGYIGTYQTIRECKARLAREAA